MKVFIPESLGEEAFRQWKNDKFDLILPRCSKIDFPKIFKAKSFLVFIPDELLSQIKREGFYSIQYEEVTHERTPENNLYTTLSLYPELFKRLKLYWETYLLSKYTKREWCCSATPEEERDDLLLIITAILSFNFHYPLKSPMNLQSHLETLKSAPDFIAPIDQIDKSFRVEMTQFIVLANVF